MFQYKINGEITRKEIAASVSRRMWSPFPFKKSSLVGLNDFSGKRVETVYLCAYNVTPYIHTFSTSRLLQARNKLVQ